MIKMRGKEWNDDRKYRIYLAVRMSRESENARGEELYRNHASM